MNWPVLKCTSWPSGHLSLIVLESGTSRVTASTVISVASRLIKNAALVNVIGRTVKETLLVHDKARQSLALRAKIVRYRLEHHLIWKLPVLGYSIVEHMDNPL